MFHHPSPHGDTLQLNPSLDYSLPVSMRQKCPGLLWSPTFLLSVFFIFLPGIGVERSSALRGVLLPAEILPNLVVFSLSITFSDTEVSEPLV